MSENFQLNVRQSSGNTFKITVSLSMKVALVKEEIVKAIDVPVVQQRLIYKGRILKDEQTLESYEVKKDHTIHFVKGAAPASNPPTSGSANVSVNSNADPPSNSSQNPFGLNFSSSTQGANPLGGMFGPGMAAQQEALRQNPELLNTMMQSPMFQSIMSNPELIRSAMQSNPEMQRVLEANPQLNHVLRDPEIMRQTMEAMRNPAAMREMMRNQDTAMRNVESHPEGFNALRRMYQDVQEPLMNAAQGSGASQSTPSFPMPGQPGGATTPAATLNESTPSASTNANPWAQTPGLSNMSPAGGDFTAAFDAMRNNPAMQAQVQGTMQTMMSDPNFMAQMEQMSPQIRSMMDSNPGLREMMQNPDFLRLMSSSSATQGLSGAFPQGQGQLDFSQFLQGATGGAPGASNLLGFTGQQPPAATSAADLATQYASQISQLNDMGFSNLDQNIRALRLSGGNVSAAVEKILAQRSQHDHIFNLQVQGDKYARLMVTQKHRIIQLDAQLKDTRDTLKELRILRKEADKRGGGVNAVKSCLASEQKEIGKLENRLAAGRTRESKLIAYNNRLKQQVDRLRSNRVLSQQIYEKHQKRLRELQRLMHQTFEESTNLMMERDKFVAQVKSLSAEKTNEEQSFDECFTSLARIVSTEKENAAAYRKEALQMDPMDTSTDFVRGNLMLSEELDLKTTIKKMDEQLEDEQCNVKVINEKLAIYHATIAKLRDLVNVDDPSKIVDVFSAGEEENFALYRYIQNVNNEIEQLDEQKTSIDAEREAYARDLREGSAQTRKKFLDQLEESKKKIIADATQYEGRRSIAVQKFHPVSKAIDKLFLSLGCGDFMQANSSNASKESSDYSMSSSKRQSSMDDLLAAHGVSENNILQFLAIIENRSSDVIQQFIKRSAAKTTPENTLIGVHLNANTSAPTIGQVISLLPDGKAPAVLSGDDENVGSDDEEVEKPLSTNELHRRAAASNSNLQILTSQNNKAPNRSKIAARKK